MCPRRVGLGVLSWCTSTVHTYISWLVLKYSTQPPHLTLTITCTHRVKQGEQKRWVKCVCMLSDHQRTSIWAVHLPCYTAVQSTFTSLRRTSLAPTTGVRVSLSPEVPAQPHTGTDTDTIRHYTVVTVTARHGTAAKRARGIRKVGYPSTHTHTTGRKKRSPRGGGGV